MRIMIFLWTVLICIGVYGCALISPEGDDSLQTLAGAEIEEYEGEDLSSVLDFRENSIAGPQYVDMDSYVLTIDGLVQKPAALTYEEVLLYTLYEKMVTLHCVEGWSVDILWEGVLLKDLFDSAGVADEATTVIFYSYDGYTTSLPLSVVLDKNMIMAYKMNGIVLPPERGFPFQLVAEDKLGYKWAKWITRIELSDDTDYKGYWEQRGYDNRADLDAYS